MYTITCQPLPLRRNAVRSRIATLDSFTAFTVDFKQWCWRSLLRHCVTSRKVGGSIPDGVIWIFNSHISSGRAMTLVSTQPVTEMSAKYTRPVHRVGKLNTFMIRLFTNFRSPKGLFRPVMGYRVVRKADLPDRIWKTYFSVQTEEAFSRLQYKNDR